MHAKSVCRTSRSRRVRFAVRTGAQILFACEIWAAFFKGTFLILVVFVGIAEMLLALFMVLDLFHM